MSMYVNFYLKSRDGKFNPIGSFSRNSEIYQAIYQGLPYEKVKPITESYLSGAVDKLERKVVATNKQIEDYWQIINEQIPKWNNPVSEKMESISNYREAIEDNKEFIKELYFAIGYFNTLIAMIDDIRYRDEYDKDGYIYVGVEVSDEDGDIKVAKE